MGTKSISEINDIRDKLLKGPGSDSASIYVHMGTCGIASGALDVLESLKMNLKANNSKKVKIINRLCRDLFKRTVNNCGHA